MPDRNDSFLSHLDNRWGGAVKDVLHGMLGDAWDYSGRLKRGQRDRHEKIFLQSPFPVIEECDFPVREELTVDDIIGLPTEYLIMLPPRFLRIEMQSSANG